MRSAASLCHTRMRASAEPSSGFEMIPRSRSASGGTGWRPRNENTTGARSRRVSSAPTRISPGGREMCGICGVYDPRGGIDVDLVRRMNETLHHRGPDADAVKAVETCVLAYKRLSIIDLPTGFQPMSDESGHSWIVYNGEIYNYKPLREGLLERGHTLRTNSDTEAIVHLYEEKGPDALHELNGMFAFAIWDEGERRLLLARDRLGIKPLYFREAEGRIAFASEIKGILADPTVPRSLDRRALADYLTFQNVFGDKTFFEGIKGLPPGHYLTAQDGRAEVREYWDLSFPEGVRDEAEAVKRFRALLDESVEMQLMSDVPLGSHLSGGLDSSAIVLRASQDLADRLKTFSVYFAEKEYDESGLIEEVSLLADTIHYDLLLDPTEFPKILPRILYHLDEPRVGPSVIPQWYIAELASREGRVVPTRRDAWGPTTPGPSSSACSRGAMPVRSTGAYTWTSRRTCPPSF